jgi:hypothetical protein
MAFTEGVLSSSLLQARKRVMVSEVTNNGNNLFLIK